ncbi:MAG: hypothetical protein ILO43_10065 [Clostridia bacterium]|nr:hypothetical protein [Clostridia bacterium]
MKKSLKKVIAILTACIMMMSVASISALAANRNNVRHYGTYVCIGDSVASGFGLPDYNRRGKKIIYKTRIKGSYADHIARDTGAKFYSLAYPGFTSGTLRYELQDNYKMKWWEINQLANFTGGVYTKKWLEKEKSHIRNTIRKADLITIDIGVNDSWYGTIALIYEIAKYGKITNSDPRTTLDAELEEFGSWGTVVRNAMYYLAGFAENPDLWAKFWSAWIDNLSTYFFQYQQNYNAIIQEITRLNRHCTIVGLSSANSFKYLNFTPGVESGSYKITLANNVSEVELPYIGKFVLPDCIHVSENPVAGTTQGLYDLFYEPVRKIWEQKLPGRYYYADVSAYELIKRDFSVPMYEFMSLDNSGFNPHPTLKGSRYIADCVEKVLPARR